MLSQPSCPPAARGPQPTRRMAVAALLLGTAATAAWQWQSGWGQQGAETTTPPTVGDDIVRGGAPTPYDPASGKPGMAAARDVPCQTPAARCAACTRLAPAPGRAGHLADGDAFFSTPLSLMMYLGSVGHFTRGRTGIGAIVARRLCHRHGQWGLGGCASGVCGWLPRGAHCGRATCRLCRPRTGAAQRFAHGTRGRILGLTPSTRPAHQPGTTAPSGMAGACAAADDV